MNLLMPGEDHDLLPEKFVIFITANDVPGLGLPIYTIERRITEASFARFADGEHIICVNGQYKGDDALGKLIHDLKCRNPDEMYNNEFSERASYFKNDEGGTETMCQIMEELMEMERIEGIAEGEAKGSKNHAIRTAKTMLGLDKYSLTEIVLLSGISVEEVRELAEQMGDLWYNICSIIIMCKRFAQSLDFTALRSFYVFTQTVIYGKF